MNTSITSHFLENLIATDVIVQSGVFYIKSPLQICSQRIDHTNKSLFEVGFHAVQSLHVSFAIM